MTQGKLFPNRCRVEDDEGVHCEVDMTDEEVEQDGMCSRCADGIWHWLSTGASFVMKNPKTREFA